MNDEHKTKSNPAAPVLVNDEHIEPRIFVDCGSHKLHFLLLEDAMETLVANRANAIDRDSVIVIESTQRDTCTQLFIASSSALRKNVAHHLQ